MSAQDSSTTVIIDVQLGTTDAKAKAVDITKQITALKQEQDALKKSGDQLSATYVQNTKDIQQLGQQQKAYISLSQNQTGSVNSLKAQLALLTNQYNGLSESERKNSAQGKLLTDQTKAISDKLKEAEGAIGNNTRSVGGYEEAIKSAIASQVPFGANLITVANGLNSLGAAFEGAGVAATFASGGILLVVTAIAGVIAFASQLAPVTNKLEQVWEGMKASFIAAGESIRNGDWSNLADNMSKADIEARGLTKDLQELTAEINAQSVATAQAEEQISVLMLKLKNRRNTPAQEADYFNQIQALGLKNYDNQKELAKRSLENAIAFAINGKNVDDWTLNQLKGHGAAMAAALAEENGEINKGGAKRIADALKMQIAADQYKETVDQKAQNRRDQQDLRQEAAAKALQEKLDEIEKDKQKSYVATAESTMSIRQKELKDIDADIAKRKVMYVKYGVDSSNLETERLARISAVRKKFALEDLKTVQDSINKAARSRISTITDPFQKQNATNDQDSIEQLQAMDANITALKLRMQQGENGLTEILQAALNERAALVKKFNFEDQKLREDNEQRLIDLNKKAAVEQDDYLQRQLENEQAQAQHRMEINAQLVNSYESIGNSVETAFGKQTTIGKIALASEKAFAIAEIIINGEREKAAIAAAYGIYKLQAVAASTIAGPAAPFVSAAALAALSIAEGAEIAAVTVKEVAGVAAIVATSIGQFAGGGLVKGAGTGTSDSIPARLSNGESVINAKSTKMFYPLLSQMNEAGGGKPFAAGGVVGGTFVPTLSNQVNSDNAISRSVLNGLRGVKNVVYVEDINYGQNRYAVNIEAGNF